MHQDGTGGYDGSEKSDLPRRVGRLEMSINELTRSHVETHAALSAMEKQFYEFNQFLHTMDEKLDSHRTRRPELAGLAAVAAVVLTIGAMALSPILSRMDRVERGIDTIQPVIGQFSAERDFIYQELDNLSRTQREMQSNRFTKSDGHRLEDKFDLHVEGHPQ